MSIIAFLVVGLIAGLLARALVPGRQAMGLITTMLLGMAGSFIGGFIGSLFSKSRSVFDLQSSGLIMSVVGAIGLLLVAQALSKRRQIHA